MLPGPIEGQEVQDHPAYRVFKPSPVVLDFSSPRQGEIIDQDRRNCAGCLFVPTLPHAVHLRPRIETVHDKVTIISNNFIEQAIVSLVNFIILNY
jgi:hypothetical protein